MRDAPELYIFAHAAHAEACGFRDRHHRQYRNLRAWWPSLDPDVIRGVVWARVTVTDGAQRVPRDERQERNYQEGLHYARAMLRHEPMIWIEL